MNIYYTTVLSFLVLIILSGCGKDEKQTSVKQNAVTKQVNQTKSSMNIHDITVTTMEGEQKKLSDYAGKVLMIVNVASKCGYTKQYSSLEEIYKENSGKGFEILAFPCNDFGGQEPGSNEEIRTFCETKFGVTFPLFDKVKVLGDDKSPLYAVLTANSNPPGDIEWNFEKFIISKDGEIVARFKSKTEPDSEEVIAVIEEELKK